MNIRGIVVLLLLASGCVTTRSASLDIGQGKVIAYSSAESAPVEIGEDEFEDAVTRLVLDMRLNLLIAPRQGVRRSLLASMGGVAEDIQTHVGASPDELRCLHQGGVDRCPSLFEEKLPLVAMDRRMMALSFAFDTVWDGVEDAVRGLVDPVALRVMVVSMVGTTLVMLVAPEPITKIIAIGMTASLIAYLGAGPVWTLGQEFLRLIDEANAARSVSALRISGHRFGKVLGSNGARVLVLVALTALGGRSALASQGPKMPGFAQAARRAQTEGGFRLSAAFAGEVQTISVPAAGVLNVTLAPTAVAAVAMGGGSSGDSGNQGSILGDPDGEVHHICTNKNEISDKTGGPWTPLFEKLFKRADLPMEHVANKVRIKGHHGPHPREYHERVLKRLTDKMRGCRSADQCRTALVEELRNIARMISTPGSDLRTLLTQGGG